MKKCSAALLMVCASAAHADWVFLTQSAAGDRFYVDPDTRKAGEFPRVWIMGNYVSPVVVGMKKETIRSGKDLQEADCSEGKLRSLSLIAYGSSGGMGEVVQTENDPKSWIYAAPGSINEVIFRYLCEK